MGLRLGLGLGRGLGQGLGPAELSRLGVVSDREVSTEVGSMQNLTWASVESNGNCGGAQKLEREPEQELESELEQKLLREFEQEMESEPEHGVFKDIERGRDLQNLYGSGSRA